MKEKVVVGWSGGKDSALALYEVLKSGMEVLELLTTVTQEYDRISIHGVRTVLLEQQAEALGLSLEKMLLPKGAADKDYEKELLTILRSHRNRGVLSVVFGDIFLADVKRYRDELLTKIGMHGIYPLWGKDSRELACNFIDLGFKAVITVTDSKALGEEFSGREYNKQFLADLPVDVDPCGENGEFHSFVYDGPIFSKPVHFTKGEVVLRDNRFWYCDLVPV
ncbi:MAG TPA: diphthine--ammonia ligase [Candidatus Bathyarchaeia archaeon]|nr:diphthine--ammonia ligase [Candidatus Bathyarchaeia archaeon]